MKKIMILGAGTMGAGIAQMVAQAGYETLLRDLRDDLLDRGFAAITKQLARRVEKGEITPDEKAGIEARITRTTKLADGKDADLVLEAVLENLELKKAVYRELDELMQPNAIFASNTSSISITAIGAATRRPDKVIGMHFFYPVPMMKLVEIIKGAATSIETYETICELSGKFGKTPMTAGESPAFVFNRLILPMINEAAFILSEGTASAEDIDKAMRLGAGHTIGPLALGDVIGLDVCLDVLNVMYTEFGDSKFRPCPLIKKKVRAGFLGRKTGKGFFVY